MIYREGNQSPTKKHPNILEANEEATRLCTKHPEEYFYVLEGISIFRGRVTIEESIFS